MKIKIIVTLMLLALVMGCNKTIRDEKGDIISVWKHEVGRYSITIKEGNTLIDKAFYRTGECEFTLITDVPEGSNMWYEAHYYEDWNERGYQWVKIHIHSVDDISNAGWNHGKFGSGMTERVQ
jgi:hypothetical protein